MLNRSLVDICCNRFKRRSFRLAARPQKDGNARPLIVAEIASSLADMLFAQNKLEDARTAVTTAINAAEVRAVH